MPAEPDRPPANAGAHGVPLVRGADGGAPTYRALVETAEAARWRLGEVPWDAFQPARIWPGLTEVVRGMAYHEQATFSATQRFMQAFADDADFTQWVSVWFYEETRHPLMLMRWVELAGETFDASFVIRGRISTPFMRSKMGTLVTNVISEITASMAYLSLGRAVEEPLLQALCRRIATDEARHAASFFRYARRRLEGSADLDRDRLDAVKVLHFWLNESQSVTHPVNQAMARLREQGGLAAACLPDIDELRARVCRAVGILTGTEIEAPADAGTVLARLVARAHAGR